MMTSEDVIETASAIPSEACQPGASKPLSGPTSSRPSVVATAMSRSRPTDGSTTANTMASWRMYGSESASTSAPARTSSGETPCERSITSTPGATLFITA